MSRQVQLPTTNPEVPDRPEVPTQVVVSEVKVEAITEVAVATEGVTEVAREVDIHRQKVPTNLKLIMSETFL